MYYLEFKSSGRIIGYSEDYHTVWDLFCRLVNNGHPESEFMIVKEVDIYCPFDSEGHLCIH